MAGSKVSRRSNVQISNSIKSLSKFIKKLDTVPTEILTEEAVRIEAEARLLTPIGDGSKHPAGRLQKGVKVSVSKNKRAPGIYAIASAVAHGYNYAGVQHENEEFNHPRGGQAKYLEKPFLEGVERIINRLEEELTID